MLYPLSYGGAGPGRPVGPGAETRLKAYLMADVVARTCGSQRPRCTTVSVAGRAAVLGFRAGQYPPPGELEKGKHQSCPTGEEQAQASPMGPAFGTIPISPTPPRTPTPASNSSNRRFVPRGPGAGAKLTAMTSRADSAIPATARDRAQRATGRRAVRRRGGHRERSNAGIWPVPTAPTAMRDCKSTSRAWPVMSRDCWLMSTAWPATGNHRPCEMSTRPGRRGAPGHRNSVGKRRAN